MACEFIMQLSKLRKSSAESVENTNAFNHFKWNTNRIFGKAIRKGF